MVSVVRKDRPCDDDACDALANDLPFGKARLGHDFAWSAPLDDEYEIYQ